ncbi:hypothetical protein [Acinetobacter bereziniae]|uniref:hypothetical protein n=1 Tax=Acinetobacter bereziniae TaxID=106648 RepID=UPI00124E9A3E|nr:hypothetical protein [Acinetobacter bereziniae]
MNKLNQIFNRTLISTLFLFTMGSFAHGSEDYTTTVKVNGIELNQAISAVQVDKLLGKNNQKITKEYAECTGNYEYSTSTPSGKDLKFEIFAEDNPQIKSDSFYKNKQNFQQLGTTKGRVWLAWSNSQNINDSIFVNNQAITHQYTLNQFKKDFPNSAKNGTDVLILTSAEAKQYLKKPTEFEIGYTAYIHFDFKNGKLNKLEINQGMAC